MNVAEFIAELQKCPQDAEMVFKFNVIDDQDDNYDELGEAQLITPNHGDKEVEIIVLPMEEKQGSDFDDSLHMLLDEDFHNNDFITIQIDLTKGMYIVNEMDEMIRELDFSKEALTWSREARIQLCILKLRKML